MKPLTEYARNGFDFLLLRREGRIAIFAGSKPEHFHPNYEVIRIQINKAGERFGKFHDATESCPRNELWGNEGWTFQTIEDATAKFEELTRKPV